VDKESRQMQRRSDEWLSGWQKSQAGVNNPELKALSERRSAQTLERFQSIDGSLAAARKAFAPFIANLQDVKKVVGNDLTPKGVAGVASTAVVQNANQSGAAAARALDVTIADLQVLTQTLAPSPSAGR
jgi:murein L,D-transpeptidase YcbB/YkuD